MTGGKSFSILRFCVLLVPTVAWAGWFPVSPEKAAAQQCQKEVTDSLKKRLVDVGYRDIRVGTKNWRDFKDNWCDAARKDFPRALFGIFDIYKPEKLRSVSRVVIGAGYLPGYWLHPSGDSFVIDIVVTWETDKEGKNYYVAPLPPSLTARQLP